MLLGGSPFVELFLRSLFPEDALECSGLSLGGDPVVHSSYSEEYFGLEYRTVGVPDSRGAGRG